MVFEDDGECDEVELMWKFTGKKPNAPDITSMKQRDSTLSVRTPQGGNTVWVNIPKQISNSYQCSVDLHSSHEILVGG